MPFSAAPDVKNRTSFAFEPAFLSDEEGRPLFVPIVKATFAIGSTGKLELAPQQPVNLTGEYWGDPDTSSYKYEPECAFEKLATDIALLGHAYASGRTATEVSVSLRVGSIEKVVTVIGDRYWEEGLAGRIRMSTPERFERIPLIYERAFGGFDQNDAERRACEVRNPVGRGFRVRWDGAEHAVSLPNLEDPQNRIRSLSDRPAPAGFGFLSPHWQPRVSFAGTYDASWTAERSPLLPRDFNRRFFNAASPGLIAPGYLAGDEPVSVVNVSPNGSLDFSLPGIAAPQVEVTLRDGGVQTLPTHLDTVVIDADKCLLVMIWRAHLTVSNVPRDVAAVSVQ